jgi:PhnB protein
VFISDEHPEIDVISPETLGGTGVGLHLLVEDADATFERAIAAGGKAVRPIEDEPWGQKSGTLKDPFRHQWFVTQRMANLCADDMDKIGKAAGYKRLS